MGLIQNKVTVSQPNSHVVVKNAGGLRGLTGETGPQGPQGVPGEAATVTAGTTTTLPAGSDATVQNVGSTSAAIFNFGIPKGDKGDTGESGAAATISVGSTSTLPAGSSATVTNSGTSSAAVFDFGIPKGDKGDTGDTGADGYSPSATVTKTGDTATITITDKDGTTTASISDGSTPTVNDGTLTIQKNGTTVQTFSADQASNVTANITVPTQFSELSGMVSSSQIEDEAITTGSVTATGTNITLAGTMEGGAIDSVEMNGDTTQQTYSGKNLLDESLMVQGTFNYLNNQDSAHSGIIRMSSFIPCQSNTTYTISSNAILGEFAVVYKDSNGNVVEGSGWSIENSKYTSFTTKSNAVQMRVRVGKGAYPHTAGVDYALQIELGGQPTSYEPYVGGTASPNPDYPQTIQTVTGRQVVTISDGGSQNQEYEVNLGKNLFDTEQAVTKFENSAGATVVSWGSYSDGVVTITRSNGAYGATLFAGFIPRLIEGETYTLSATVRLSGTATGTGLRIGTNDTTPVYTTLASKDTWIDASFTFTATAQIASDPRICINANNTGNIVEIKNIQLEKGSVATTYAPYFTPIELCKIGTYQDYIYKSGEDWYVHKETWNYTFDGSSDEQWIRSGQSTPTNFIAGMVNLQEFAMIGGNADSGYCNYFDFSIYLDDNKVILSGYQSGGYRFLLYRFPSGSTVTDLASFTTWLGNHPLKMVLVLSTPTDTQITNSALIAQLEDLLSATTYAGTTYITVSGDLASPLEVVTEADSKLAPNSVYGAAIKDGAVSVDKIEDGAVTPAKISTSAYQSGETAVGTWIDGKTIYRQVLAGTVQITANNVATVTTTIAAKSIVSTSGWYQSWKQNDTTSNKVAFGHIMGDKVYSYALIRSDNYIELGFISSVNVNSQYEVVVEYTKKD